MKAAALPLLLAATLLLGACATDQPVVGAASTAPQAAAAPSNLLPVSDIPIPAGAKLDAENTFIMGTDDRWLGRIVIKTDSSPVQGYNHFFSGMPAQGWVPVAAVQAHTSSLTFMRDARIASILIEPLTLGGTKIHITVSPKQMPPQENAPVREDRAAGKPRPR
jgi:hypothetical protein